MTHFGSIPAYSSPFHDYGTPLAFELILAVVQASVVAAMEDADVPPQYRLRLANRLNGRLLASELNPHTRAAVD